MTNTFKSMEVLFIYVGLKLAL